ncbi:hypothetical protein SAMN04488066_10949 [Halorubrum aquaticum]|uniref:Uncharacterized protein n=1 Tax=Halorubrum aquaticum TaxID=387340 RepID=A0A1I3B3H0_9EURY|nr:hypothetical protein [Halorubrum aquaticum]SFH56844.1 hypothetical protein SAMN04488066_10949 [Halorubrum aquaticum]
MVTSRIDEWVTTTWRSVASTWGLLLEFAGIGPDVDPHTRVTFRAIADAVVPETPALAEELGPEHVAGGLAVDLDEFAITYVDDGFQFGLPHLGPQGNMPIADPIAHVLDTAALTLLERGDNEEEPSLDRALSLLGPDDPSAAKTESAVGPFAKLSRRDRLRAIAILDEFEVEFSPTDHDLLELDAGLVGQLVVGFMEMIYYSEWQGYDDFTEPPSRRNHPNDPDAVQSWRQTGFPGFANGYAALRGYVGTDDGPLGDGDAWTTIDETTGVRIRRESGSFRENDYDTGGYEEPFPVESG